VISTNSEKVRNIYLLPIGSHIKVHGIKPYGFDYKIGNWIRIKSNVSFANNNPLNSIKNKAKDTFQGSLNVAGV
jgi:hypothetical protein